MDSVKILLFAFSGILNIVLQAHTLERQKRFLTPTTYPVPTKPHVTVTPDHQKQLTGSAIVQNSRPVNCPVKRSTRKKRIVLDQRMMKEIYLELVGNFDKTVMAETLEEADRNFVHLPLITDRKQQGQTHDSVIKSDLLEDILKFNRWYESIRRSLYNDPSSPMFEEERNDTRDNMTLQDTLEALDITITQLKQILDIKHDMELVIGHVPADERRKRAASTSGSTSIQQYCVNRGSSTTDGYLHMCKTCSINTQLPADRYPRVINEADCDKIDCNCFTANGMPHGKCIPIVHHVKMLRQKANGCRLLIQNGTQFILGNWELYDQTVRVGCECVLNKISVYAPLVVG